MRSLSRALIVVVALATALLGLSGPAQAADDDFAPLDRPGPALSVPTETIDAALQCWGDPATGPTPILLSPATGVEPHENFSWNWLKVFQGQGRYTCAIKVPHKTLGDIQVAGEYIVHAIRTMHARTGRKIAILGHSQGGMSPRWALRFWPDTRAMVTEMVGMAATSHGTTVAIQCVEGVTTCMPGVWQQRDESDFVAALNSRTETFAGIDYTMVYSRYDEVATPPPASGLRTGPGGISNILVQDVCPLDVTEHLLVGTISPGTYAVVMDALDHDGPARLDRVDRSWCLQPTMPGVDLADLTGFLPLVTAVPTVFNVAIPLLNVAGVPQLAAEPALRCYALAAGCAGAPAVLPPPPQGAAQPATSPGKNGKKGKRGENGKKKGMKGTKAAANASAGQVKAAAGAPLGGAPAATGLPDGGGPPLGWLLLGLGLVAAGATLLARARGSRAA